MPLLWNALTKPANNYLKVPQGFDGGLFLGKDEDVSVNTTLTYSYQLNDATPVSGDTWLTNHHRAMTLDNAHSYHAAIALLFNTITFATNSSRVDIVVTQQRLATDTTTAPIIGAGSVTCDGFKAAYPQEYKGLWMTIPLHFLPYADQPNRALSVNITLVDAPVLDKATLLLAPMVSLSREGSNA